VTFRNEDGRELFDLPDAPRPDPDTPAPPRLVPEYDNLLLSHADRSHVIVAGYRERIFTRGAALVDGFVVGAWRFRKERAVTRLELELFEAIKKRDRDALVRESNEMLAFVAPDARSLSIEFV
jgi:Winged helix DNA-binding domain